MAVTRGCNGEVWAGPTPTQVGEVTAWTFEETSEQIDASAMGTCTKKFEAGAVQTTGSIDLWWDGDDAGQDLLNVGDKIDIILRPEGTGSGLAEFTGNSTILSTSVTANVDSIVTASVGFAVNGAMTEGTQA